jgi:small-conductance mechanosensitive channel
MMRELLDYWRRLEVGGNTVQQWLVAGGVVLGLALVLRVVQAFLLRRLARRAERTATRIDDLFIHVLHATSPWFHLSMGIVVARNLVVLGPGVATIVRVACGVVIGLQFGRWAQTAVSEGIGAWAATREGSQSATMAAGLRFLARLVIWTLVVLAVLSNMGVELSAVVAGLGVGGVAAALAVQSTLGDLIAGISMYFDRPFDIGDFIIVDDFMGTVQRIGTRTTRVASLAGEEIVFPNSDLVKSRIRNYARMRERRVVFAFGIEYNLPAEKIERACRIAEDIIRSRDGIRFDRAHFKQYGAYSLDYEVVYYVLSADYTVYMDQQHAINLALYRRFEEEGIPFAFPTQVVFTRKLDGD